MMKIAWIVSVVLCGVSFLWGQESEQNEKEVIPDLPQWSAEDWESLRNGEIVPGSTIFGEIARDRLFSGKMDPIVVNPRVREVPEEEPGVEEDSSMIEGSYLGSYFHDAPRSYLVDPQSLLTKMQQNDQEGFLKFHAEDSGLDLYLYLFDSRQEVPVGESMQGVILDHFAEKGPAAVVFYFMGEPSRAELSFSEDLAGMVSRGEKRDLVKLSVEEALEHEEPLAQLEAFSDQLSQRLSWLERKLTDQGVLNERAGESGLAGEGENEPGALSALWLDFRSDARSFYLVMGSLAFAGGVGLFIFVRYLVDRKRVFVFPDAQGSPLLGAPHAPGVGSVLSYANRAEPPALQRNNFPDYLRRL